MHGQDQSTLTVSIITPVTGHPCMRKCLESVRNQKCQYNVEHIIVIDGKEHEEKVMPVINQLETTKAQLNLKTEVVCLPFPTGKDGWNGHRIYGATVFLARGQYIAFLDEDNYFSENHIETMMKEIEGGQNDWVYCLRNIVGPKGQFLCQDNCESLGYLHPMFNNSKDFLVDTSCYLVKKNAAVMGSYVWNRPARPPAGLMEADRAYFQFLKQWFPKFSCTCQYTLNYLVNNRADSVTGKFFQLGNTVMQQRNGKIDPETGVALWDKVKQEERKRVLYLCHFQKEPTERVLGLPYVENRSFAFEQWQLTLLDDFKKHFQLRSAYDRPDEIPTGSVVIFHLWHPIGFPKTLLQRNDIKKVLYTVESPNKRHREQWSQQFLNLFDIILTYWDPVVTNLENAMFCPFPYRLNMDNPYHLSHLLCNNNFDKRICIVLENRPGKGSYEVMNQKLICLDHLRLEFVLALENIVCYGKGWENIAVSNQKASTEYVTTDPAKDPNRTIDIMNRYTFTLIVENCNAEDYVSEKIYDAFAAGSIPIYYGNIGVRMSEIIPADTYIDARKFSTPWELANWLKSITVEQITEFKEAIYAKRKTIMRKVSPAHYFDLAKSFL